MFHRGGGGPYSMGRILWNMDPRVHIQWGSIFDLTTALPYGGRGRIFGSKGRAGLRDHW